MTVRPIWAKARCDSLSASLDLHIPSQISGHHSWTIVLSFLSKLFCKLSLSSKSTNVWGPKDLVQLATGLEYLAYPVVTEDNWYPIKYMFLQCICLVRLFLLNISYHKCSKLWLMNFLENINFVARHFLIAVLIQV